MYLFAFVITNINLFLITTYAANNLHLTGLYISHDTSLHILRIKSGEKSILTVIHNGTDFKVFLQKVTIK